MVERRKLVRLARGSEVNEVLDSLLALAFDLHADHGRVNHLSAYALELAVVAEVNLNVVVLGKEFTDQLEHAEEGLVEGALFHLGLLGHSGEVGLDHGVELDLSLGLVLCHLGVVVEAEHAQVVFVEFDVGDALIVHQVLEADRAEVGQVHCALKLDLAVGPTKKFKWVGNV